MIALWKRYLLSDFLATLALFICSFYSLYILIDYSVHASQFAESRMSFGQITIYYLCQMTRRAEIILPFAILLSTIRVLTRLNGTHELLALRAGGFSIHRLLSPLLFVSLAMAAFVLLNFEVLSPNAIQTLQTYEDHYMGSQGKKHINQPMGEITLDDGSLLLYGAYDRQDHSLLDTYWIRNPQTIIHMKSVELAPKIPLGRYVDFLKKNKEGHLLRHSSSTTASFPGLSISPQRLEAALKSKESHRLSQLWRFVKKIWSKSADATPEAELQILTTFYLRILLPLACLLAFIGPAPYCILYQRQPPLFMIYSLGIFGLVTFFTVMDATTVLGQHGVMTPALAIALPCGVFGVPCLIKYVRMS